MKTFKDTQNYYNENNSSLDYNEYLSSLKNFDRFILEPTDTPKDTFVNSMAFFDIVSPRYAFYYSWLINFKGRIENKYLCDSIAYYAMLLFSDYGSHSKHVEYFDNPLFKQGIGLLTFMACRKFDVVDNCYPFIIDGLKTMPTGDLGEIPPQRLGILAVEMLASEQNQIIDWDSMAIPFDHFYRNFVREALYSKNESLVKEWLIALCDNHVHWSARPTLVEEEVDYMGYEIEESHLLLWPFEYQAVKNFRAKHGLSTPEIDHPLLKTPMAIDHRPDFSQWQAPEWFYPLLDKLIAINPKISFAKDLFK
ncbi:hypothetical protein [Pectobacterium parmentieri]|uniref:hypothetical protein n=2 Tax=Pectobacterium parmentieri TaxID=1905730 RepID=UPI000EADABDB|nr:hypothetical protein [Pectobacterium parmentieri]AYH02956.1 hypothetical protein C5E26_19505 [Pectobacterium parmentieri]AYH29215.1 hypothetical protein C5E20_19860 [Pectobacterium parmentieri]AYH33633.1 hypothetical protein C5E19_19490 [Pectobacterium parmentieri]